MFAWIREMRHPTYEELKAENAALRAELAEARKRIEELQQLVQKLQVQLNQNSRNSSKPPSSDPPWTSSGPQRPSTGRRPGGQPGHEAKRRDLLPMEQVDEIVVLKPLKCKGCGHPLKGTDREPLRHQVTELPPLRSHTTEYQRHRVICPHCQTTTLADLPEGISESCFGPRVEAITAYLSGRAHLSKRQIAEGMEDLFEIPISVGSVSAIEQRVSQALEAPVQEARTYVEEQPVKHADETGWKEGAQRAWLWTAVTATVTIFLIHASRGAQAARALLGSFAGYLITDRWNAYNDWPLRRRQLCWAHLIRDFEGFLERGAASAKIGAALLREVSSMFALWYRVRDGTLKRSSFQEYMRPIRRRVQRLLKQGSRCGESKTEGMCRMILKPAPALWTFVRVEGVEPTNNRAERAIRPVVLYRKGSFGTHSPEGSRFVERIMTVVATLRQQGRNVLDYLTQTCIAARYGHTVPSLLPAVAQRTAA